MISFKPALDRVWKVAKRPYHDLEAEAVERWVETPASVAYIPPAICLPGQLDRMRATMFSDAADIRRSFAGDFEIVEGETLGFRVRGVDLVGGVLYGRCSVRHLRARPWRQLAYRPPTECLNGVLYES